MPRPKVSESIKAFKSARERGVCYHPLASKAECSAKFARAHTVQESLLRKIACKGHVLGYATDYGAQNPDDLLVPRPIGVGKASTFNGFCEKHDQALFLDIEQNEIQACTRHACLLSFRAICRELHAKEGVLGLMPHLRTLDQGLPLVEQLALQSDMARRQRGSMIAKSEIEQRKRIHDAMLLSENYEEMRYFVVWFQDVPDIMCSAGFHPTSDYAGNVLQNLGDHSISAQGATFSLVASGNKGCAHFSWLNWESKSSIAFFRSLLQLGRAGIPHAITRLAFQFENQFWKPEWWESLTHDQKARVLARFRMVVHPNMPMPSLVDDGLRVVNWQVTTIDTNETALLDC